MTVCKHCGHLIVKMLSGWKHYLFGREHQMFYPKKIECWSDCGCKDPEPEGGK